MTVSTPYSSPRPGTGSTPERAAPEVAQVRRAPVGRLALGCVEHPATRKAPGAGGSRTSATISGREADPFSRTGRPCPAPFADMQRHQVEWTNYLTPQAVIDLVASRSYCITSPAEARTRTLR